MTKNMDNAKEKITELIVKAKEKAYQETSQEPEAELTHGITWPVECTVGPGLEGAIACESKVGYVNGSKGWLIYRGYDIFDLCAYTSFEEVSYLLLHGELPTKEQLTNYQKTLGSYLHLPDTKRLLMSFPIEEFSAMAALRLGVNLMRQKQTYRDYENVTTKADAIATDEDSIPMETKPKGEKKPIYEFRTKQYPRPRAADSTLVGSEGLTSAYHLVAGVATITAAIARVRNEHMPLEPEPDLSYAANLLYMMTGKRPTPIEERVMDVCLILHADHGMNASTFASMVVASTLSDIYFSIGSGVAALNGPLHGGANEKVVAMLQEIPDIGSVDAWYDNARKLKRKIMGFGHRVYKAYDPRARILKPLAKMLVASNPEMKRQFAVAEALEKKVVQDLGQTKKIFPNVDYYSGLVYRSMGIESEYFTPIFAVSRVAGWCARILEYLDNNRIFRPRAMYIGDFNKKVVPIGRRKSEK